MLGMIIVVEMLLVVFSSVSTTASPKSTERIIGGVYNPGEDFGNTAPGGVASYGNATFYTSNVDQYGADKYDVQYYGYHIGDPYSSGYAHHYGYHPGPDAYWYAPQDLYNNIPGGTEYMVIVETINGVNDWSGANFTGSTNMTATDDKTDYLPDIFLEQIPTPNLKSINYTSGEIVINWTGLDEWISENSVASSQKWKIQASNILSYSVYRSDGGLFERVGNATQNRSGEVLFEDTVEPGDYYYRIAVNYKYANNTGLIDKEHQHQGLYNVLVAQGYTPENSTMFPGMYVTHGRSNVSEVICTDINGPWIENMQPEDGSVLNTNTTTISADYSDDSGIDVSSVVLKINDVNYTSKAVITETGISYDYTNMSDGNYTVYLEVKDNSSKHNKASKTWSFTVDTTPPKVKAKAPTGDKVLVYDEIYITFSESMDKTVDMADVFSIEPYLGGWTWGWYENDTKVRGTHPANPFTANTTYNCTISTNAKDEHGNNMANPYSWNFTTIANLSVTLNWPYIGTEHWTGGSNHTINYSVGGGLPDYEVKISYSYNGGDWIFLTFDNQTDAGTYEYMWRLPLIDSETTLVRVEVKDALGATLSKTSNYFIIDSTKPTVNRTSPLDGSYTPLGCDIEIVFDKSMNPATVGASGGSLLGCSCALNPGGWAATWSDGDKKLTLSHNDFTADQLYTFTVSTDAKDKSDPGNPLNNSYSWSFTAVPSRGVFTVSIDCPASAEVGEEYRVTVTVNNAELPIAYNNSGTLTVKFYKIHAGETPVQIGTAETIDAMQPGASETKSSALFTFDKPGTWYIKVEISSTNPIDIIQGYTQSYDTSVPVNVVKPEAPEEIGIGPYILIIVMVALVAVVGALTLFGIKKKKKTEK